MFRDLSEESVSRSFGRKCFQTFRVKVFQKKMHFRGEYVSDPGRICLVENATKHDLSIFAFFAFPHFCISTAFCGHYNPKGGHARPWPDIFQRTRDIYICARNLTIHTQHQPPHAPKSKTTPYHTTTKRPPKHTPPNAPKSKTTPDHTTTKAPQTTQRPQNSEDYCSEDYCVL